MLHQRGGSPACSIKGVAARVVMPHLRATTFASKGWQHCPTAWARLHAGLSECGITTCRDHHARSHVCFLKQQAGARGAQAFWALLSCDAP